MDRRRLALSAVCVFDTPPIATRRENRMAPQSETNSDQSAHQCASVEPDAAAAGFQRVENPARGVTSSCSRFNGGGHGSFSNASMDLRSSSGQ